jgi:hypothetical protein
MKFFVLATIAIALATANSAANAQAEDSFYLVYHCDETDPGHPQLLFGNNKLFQGRLPKKRIGSQRYERINVAKLVMRSDGANAKRPRSDTRDGSREIRRQCGVISMLIMGDYLNDNPDGHMGASIFPYVRLLLHGKLVYSVAIGECDTPSGPFDRYQHERGLSCPDGWATSVSASVDTPPYEPDEDSPPELNLLIERKNIEFVTVPQPIIPPDAAR